MSNERLIHGDCLEKMKEMEDNTIDTLITDPPAGISFMGKDWDSDKGGRDNWIKWMQEVATECKRVVKPGGHAFVWALPRTSHWTATAWENAGFEIRDVVAHIFGSGFPKSHNIGKSVDKLQGNEREVIGKQKLQGTAATLKGKANRDNWYDQGAGGTYTPEVNITKGTSEWEGWGSALKPAREDWLLMRKPLEKGLTIAQNCLKWGTGGINIDESRVDYVSEYDKKHQDDIQKGQLNADNGKFFGGKGQSVSSGNLQGRFPANLILSADEDGQVSQEVRECFPETKGEIGRVGRKSGGNYEASSYKVGVVTKTGIKDSGNASRFFKSIIYQPKASKSERNKGMDIEKEPNKRPIGEAFGSGNAITDFTETKGNNHPTVKPIALMQYLITMITPKGGTVLDPFMGSGTTGVACKNLNRKFIGIEKYNKYFEIAKNRINKTIY